MNDRIPRTRSAVVAREAAALTDRIGVPMHDPTESMSMISDTVPKLKNEECEGEKYQKVGMLRGCS